MIRLKASSHKIETVFILALFTMFAATAFLVVLIGAKQYQVTADYMNDNYEVRTASSYLQEKIRSNDTSDAITITELDGTPALAFTSIENDTEYTTYIYYFDGMLRELFVTSNSVYALDGGQKIIALHSFLPEWVSDNLIKITYTGTDDSTYTLYLKVHSASGKEAL